jgi:hypothetical protein
MFTNHTFDRGLLCRKIYQGFLQLNGKTNSTNEKLAKELNRPFFKKDINQWWCMSTTLVTWKTKAGESQVQDYLMRLCVKTPIKRLKVGRKVEGRKGGREGSRKVKWSKKGRMEEGRGKKWLKIV